MPTYKSKSNKVEHLDFISFAPGEEKQVRDYINLNVYPFLVKTSDSPNVLHPFKPILSDISLITNMSDTLQCIGQIVLKITDNRLGCADGDQVVVAVFGGDTDTQSDFMPISMHRFIRMSQNDREGVSFPFWICKHGIDSETGFEYDNPIVKNIKSSISNSFLLSIAVTSITLSGGSIDVNLKNWG